MGDKELIEEVAQIWTDNGGDRDGLFFCLSELADRIGEMRKEKDNTDNDEAQERTKTCN